MPLSMSCPARHVSNCQCSLDQIWDAGLLKVYPKSKLMAYGRLLLHIPEWCRLTVFPKHRMPLTTRFELYWVDNYVDFYLELFMYGNTWRDWVFFKEADAVGLWRVRAIQRWWRRRMTAIWQERALAVAMGLHKRLGAESQMRAMDNELLRLIVQTHI